MSKLKDILISFIAFIVTVPLQILLSYVATPKSVQAGHLRISAFVALDVLLFLIGPRSLRDRRAARKFLQRLRWQAERGA